MGEGLPAGDEVREAARRKIIATGRSVSRLRVGLFPAVWLTTIGLKVPGFEAALAWYGNFLDAVEYELGPNFWLGLAIGAALALPVAAIYRRLQEHRLAKGLANLPPGELRAILKPLEDAAGDTRRLTFALLRALRASAEAVPESDTSRLAAVREQGAPQENDIRALQDQLRRAGRSVRRLRMGIFGTVAGLLLAHLVWLFIDYPWPGIDRRDLVAPYLQWGATFVGVGFVVALPFAALLRRWRRRRMRSVLAGIPPDQRALVLLPLQHAGGDLRRIVTPLLREFGLRTEIAPSGPPARQGREVSPGAPLENKDAQLPDDAGAGAAPLPER